MDGLIFAVIQNFLSKPIEGGSDVTPTHRFWSLLILEVRTPKSRYTQ